MICVVSHDAGGAEIISSYVRQNQIECKFVLAGPALSIFERKLGKLHIQDLEQAISTSDFLLCGTSWQSDIEWQAISIARKLGKKSAAFLDHWVNYRERFIRLGQLHLPDEIWVGDLLAKEKVKTIFPDIEVILIENPYFLDLKLEIERLDRNKSQFAASGKILYVCEPVREHAFHEYGDERYWGYTEEEALRYFLTNVQSLGIKIDQIIVRPHPSESANKYDWIFKEFDLPIYAGGKETLFDELLRSEIVVGCESMAMIIGMLAGRRVISCIPPGGSPCKLPQPNIEKMQDLIAKSLIKS
jgi:hypothetical protein